MTGRTIHSEEILAEWCRRGDRKSQKYLYETWANPMFRLLLRYLGNGQDADDALVTGFRKVFENIGSFSYKGKGSLEAWIRKVMVNEALMLIRSRRLFEDLPEDDNGQADWSVEPGSELEAEDVYNLVKNLPVGYRTVFNLFVIEGYSHNEIAERLSISESTSKSQLNKARKRLQEQIIKTKTGYEIG